MKTKQKIKEAGLENVIDNTIEVEANYKLKKIVGYDATSIVLKAQKFKHYEDAIGSGPEEGTIELEEKDSPRASTDKKFEIVAIKKVKNSGSMAFLQNLATDIGHVDGYSSTTVKGSKTGPLNVHGLDAFGDLRIGLLQII